MTILSDYIFCAPNSLLKVLELMAGFNSPAILSGGTDLIVNLKTGKVAPDAIIDIKQLQKSELQELKAIEFRHERLFIGSLVTFTELINSPLINQHAPILAECAKTVASTGVRNRASLVGNICSAVPCMDSAPALMVYDAVIHTESLSGERELFIHHFFTGPRKTLLTKNDLVKGISLHIPKKAAGCFLKLMRYRGEDLAQANLALMALPEDEYRVAIGSLSATPFRASALEQHLKGKSLTEPVLGEAKEILESLISPITDIRATKEYRTHSAKVMLERGLLEAKRKFYVLQQG